MTTKPEQEVISAIQALNLESVKVRAMDPELGEGWTREYADSIEVAYKHYLTMLVKYQDHAEDILLAEDVDEFWHTHILQTMKYAEDCQNVFGNFLHHEPHVGERTAADLEKRAAMAERTRGLYAREFGDARDTAWSGRAIKAEHAAYSNATIRPKNAAYSNATIRSANAAYSNATIAPKNAAYSNATIRAANSAYSNATIRAEHAAYSNATIRAGNAAYSNATITPKNAAYSNATIRAENAAYSNATIRAGNAAYSNAMIRAEKAAPIGAQPEMA
ncbi:MAG: hypothetical protein HYV99_07405 [Betaproteobacteria bacterium]|nr:hypothetical protein [Betaproteobacteria bacterium]